jgi:hypothetical protein
MHALLRKAAALSFLLGSCTQRPVFAQDHKTVTLAQVVEMMDRLPARESDPRGPTAKYSQINDGLEVAVAISLVADGSVTGDALQDAALMATYAAFESANRKCAVGDGGKALGVWQLQHTSKIVACDPLKAALHWRAMARYSIKTCSADGMPGKDDWSVRLAILLSGDCKRGLAKTRSRAQIARSIIDSPKTS